MKANYRNHRALIFSATAILGAATALAPVALAQMNPGGGVQQSGQSSQQNPSQSHMPTDPSAGMAGSGTASMADQAFVSEIFESDKAQVQLGQLAQQKSQSDDVKQLGQKMVDNRTKLDQQLQPIAQKLDVKMPKQPNKKERQEIAKLGTLSGPEFDQEYLKCVAKSNQQDVKNFEAEATAASDPNLQQAAKQDATVLAQHQKAVEQIAQTHNVMLSEK